MGRVVDTEQLKHYEKKLAYEIDSWDLWHGLQLGRELVIIDARSTEAYGREHIPGALNVPHRTINEEVTEAWSRTATYVCYCDGIGCNASTKGALNLARLGFRVLELTGGLDWWKRDGYQTGGIEGRSGTEVVCSC